MSKSGKCGALSPILLVESGTGNTKDGQNNAFIVQENEIMRGIISHLQVEHYTHSTDIGVVRR
jgi:hypothetical protein